MNDNSAYLFGMLGEFNEQAHLECDLTHGKSSVGIRCDWYVSPQKIRKHKLKEMQNLWKAGINGQEGVQHLFRV